MEVKKIFETISIFFLGFGFALVLIFNFPPDRLRQKRKPAIEERLYVLEKKAGIKNDD